TQRRPRTARRAEHVHRDRRHPGGNRPRRRATRRELRRRHRRIAVRTSRRRSHHHHRGRTGEPGACDEEAEPTETASFHGTPPATLTGDGRRLSALIIPPSHG